MTSNQLPRQVAVLLGHICQQTCFSPHQSHKQWKTRHHMANSKTLEVHLYTTSARGWSHMDNAIRSTWYKRGVQTQNAHMAYTPHAISTYHIFIKTFRSYNLYIHLMTSKIDDFNLIKKDLFVLWSRWLVKSCFHQIHELVKGLQNNPLSPWLQRGLSILPYNILQAFIR